MKQATRTHNPLSTVEPVLRRVRHTEHLPLGSRPTNTARLRSTAGGHDAVDSRQARALAQPIVAQLQPVDRARRQQALIGRRGRLDTPRLGAREVQLGGRGSREVEVGRAGGVEEVAAQEGHRVGCRRPRSAGERQVRGGVGEGVRGVGLEGGFGEGGGGAAGGGARGGLVEEVERDGFGPENGGGDVGEDGRGGELGDVV